MSEITAAAKKHDLTVYVPDTRGVTVSQYGKGNLKIGLGVYTYSRLPGHPSVNALGSGVGRQAHGTCPGATEECQAICYAARPVAEQGAVYKMWKKNSLSSEIPPIPDDCTLLRIHVSGDFDTPAYLANWHYRLIERPDVTAWAYTRSWRVLELLPSLEMLRALPNMQLFASMDKSTPELPPDGWRRAWINDDVRLGRFVKSTKGYTLPDDNNLGPCVRGEGKLQHAITFGWQEADDPTFGRIRAMNFTPSLVCPEETKDKPNCEACRYCFDGQRNDVTFLKH